MRAAKMCTNGVVVIQVLVLLSNIHVVKANNFIACEKVNVKERTLKCEEKPMICITSFDKIGTSDLNICPGVPDATPNSNCSKELVEKHVFENCNGKTTSCIIFKRSIEISPYCEKAIKYIQLSYKCVSSPSECLTLESPKEIKTTTETLPSLSINMMAQKVEFPTTISPTKAAETRTNIDENRNPTLPLSKIPATTAQEPGHEISRNFSSLVPILTSQAPNSWKKFITCAPKTTRKNMATISPKISSTKPPLVERNAGHSVLNICFIHLKVHVMVFASSIVFSFM